MELAGQLAGSMFLPRRLPYSMPRACLFAGHTVRHARLRHIAPYRSKPKWPALSMHPYGYCRSLITLACAGSGEEARPQGREDVKDKKGDVGGVT